MKSEDIKDLKELVEFLKQYQVAEFDLDRGDMKIRLKFAQTAAAPVSLAEIAHAAVAPASLPQAPVPVAAPSAAPVDDQAGLHIIKSPIVGTFYGSPSPGAAPFVVPGGSVEKGKVVGIVEAMKLMNEIESDVSGEVVKVLVSNGQAVEYGQPLFSVRAI